MRNETAKTSLNIIAGFFFAAALAAAIVAALFLDPARRNLPAQYTYDISSLAEVDPSLITYTEAAEPIETGFQNARAVAIGPDDTICVAGDTSVKIFSPAIAVLEQIELKVEPVCLAVSQDNTIYIGTSDHVQVYDWMGAELSCWQGLGQRALLTSIAVYKDNVFVADAGNRIVIRYDKNGNIISRIGAKDPQRNIPGFVIPRGHFDLAVAPDGLLRVSNTGRHSIEAYTFDGDLEFSWGSASMDIEGFCGCCNPANFAVTPAGSFITSEKGLIRVKEYSPDGAFLGVVASPNQLYKYGAAHIGEVVNQSNAASFDVAVDSRSRVYILDTIDNILRIFEKNTD